MIVAGEHQAPERSFFFAGGTLPSDSATYVVRQADSDLVQGLRQGEICYLLDSRQMGKSSLCNRTMARLKEDGIRTAFLDLTKFGGQNTTPDHWYASLISETGRQLNLRKEFVAYLRENQDKTQIVRFFGAVQEIALVVDPTPLVIFVDEIDAVRSLPFSTDEFFGAIRESFNGRMIAPELSRLTFCLVGSATPADLISDKRISPFNVGRRVVITDFTPVEAKPLAVGMGSAGTELLARVLWWTGGQPYLTQRLCQEVALTDAKTVADVDAVCRHLFLAKSARDADDSNLAFVRDRLLRDPAAPVEEVLDLYRRIRSGKRVPDDSSSPLHAALRLSGIVRLDSQGHLIVRNRIYEQVFNPAWIQETMPDAERRRQKAAALRGALQVAGFALVIVALLGGMLWRTLVAEQRAKNATRTEMVQKAIAVQAEKDARKAAETARIAAETAQKAEKTAQLAARSEKAAKNQAQKDALEAQHQRQIAVQQKAVADVERGNAIAQRNYAEAQRAFAQKQSDENRQKLVQSLTDSGLRLWKEGDDGGAAVYFLEAFNRDRPENKWKHRLRLLDSLRTIPRLESIYPVSAETDGSVMLSENGERYVNYSWSRNIIEVFRTSDNHRLTSFPLSCSIDSWKLSHDSRLLAVLATQRSHTGSQAKDGYQVWDLNSGKVITPFTIIGRHSGTWRVPTPNTNSIEFDPSNTLLLFQWATGDYPNRAMTHEVWNIYNRKRTNWYVPITSDDEGFVSSPKPVFAGNKNHAYFPAITREKGRNTPQITLYSRDAISGQNMSPPLILGNSRNVPVYNRVCISPDERYVACWSDSYATSLRLFDRKSRQLIAATSFPFGDSISMIQFSADETLMAIIVDGNPGSVNIVRTATGKEVCPSISLPMKVIDLRFTPDGHSLIVQGKKEVRIYDVDSGKIALPTIHSRSEVIAIAVSENADRLNILTRGRIASYNLATSPLSATQTKQFPFSSHTPPHLQFSPDQKIAVSYTYRKKDKQILIHLFDSQTAHASGPVVPIGFTEDVADYAIDSRVPFLRFSDKAHRLLAVVNQNDNKNALSQIVCLDYKTGRILGRITPKFPVRNTAIASDGSQIALLLARKQGSYFDRQSQLEVYKLNEKNISSRPTNQIVFQNDALSTDLGIAFSPDGNSLFRKTGYGINWYSSQTLQLIGSIKPVESINRFNTSSLRFSPTGNSVLFSWGGEGPTLLDYKNKKKISVLRHDSTVDYFQFSPDGSRIVTLSDDNTIRLWSATTGQPLTAPLLQTHTPKRFVYSPTDGASLLVAFSDGSAQLFDGLTGEPLLRPWKQLYHNFDIGFSVVIGFSTDGSTVFATDFNGIYEQPLSIGRAGSKVDDRDLKPLTDLLSGRNLDSSGALTGISQAPDPSDWKRLSTRYPGFFQTSSTDQRDWLYAKAFGAKEERKWSAASLYYAELVRSGNRDAIVWGSYARCLHYNDKTDEALAILAKGRKLFPTNDDFLYNEADIFASRGQWKASYAAYQGIHQQFFQDLVHEDYGTQKMVASLAVDEMTEFEKGFQSSIEGMRTNSTTVGLLVQNSTTGSSHDWQNIIQRVKVNQADNSGIDYTRRDALLRYRAGEYFAALGFLNDADQEAEGYDALTLLPIRALVLLAKGEVAPAKSLLKRAQDAIDAGEFPPDAWEWKYFTQTLIKEASAKLP